MYFPPRTRFRSHDAQHKGPPISPHPRQKYQGDAYLGDMASDVIVTNLTNGLLVLQLSATKATLRINSDSRVLVDQAIITANINDFNRYRGLGVIAFNSNNAAYIGPMGVTGLQGVTGAVALDGVTGLQGPQGVTGIGMQGETGYGGLTGAQGMQGVTGIGIVGNTPNQELYILQSADIANQYIDLAYLVTPNTLSFVFDGLIQYLGEDYSISTNLAGTTRVTFLNDLATGGSSALAAGDRVLSIYQHA